MSFEEVMAQLEAWGTEEVREMYARHGAGQNQFGVKLGDLRNLAKKLKRHHPLAMHLWASGNADAMILSTMLMESAQLSEAELDGMVRGLTYFKIVDELVHTVVEPHPAARSLREAWMDAPEECVARAGWNLLIGEILRGDPSSVDYEGSLTRIEAEIQAAPMRKQESMNRCLVEIAVTVPELTHRCIKLGEQVGRLDDRPVPKGGNSTYAPEWIAAIIQRKSPRTAS